MALDFASSFRSAFGPAREGDHQGVRRRSIVQGFVTAVGSRGVGAVVNFVSVPLTIGYLGTERYGIWVLLVSLVAWVGLADLGIGKGLTNSITHSIGSGRSDLVRAHISTALFILSGISVVLGLALVTAWPWLDWVALFKITTEDARVEAGPAIAVFLGFYLLEFPLSITRVTYNALQEGKTANYWSVAGNLATLLALILVTRTHGGLVWLVLSLCGAYFLVMLGNFVWLFFVYKPEYAPRLHAVSKASARTLLRVGGLFFLIQISALVVFQTDNIIIAKFIGAASVPTYSITYNLFAYTYLAQTLLSSYLWVAYADAIARKDSAWVTRTFTRNLLLSLASTFVFVALLIVIARPFIRLWAGEAVVPPVDLVYWMAGWSLINAFCSPVACLFSAANHMKAQVIYSAIAAIANLVMTIYLIKIWGIIGVIAGTVIAYVIFIIIPASVDLMSLLRKLRNAV